jgi:hypothetical protein
MHALAPNTLEFGFILFLSDELASLLAPLCEVVFAHCLGLQLRTFSNGAFTVTVACWSICCHGASPFESKRTTPGIDAHPTTY